MHYASIKEFPYMTLPTMIQLHMLSRAFKETKYFVYQQKSLIKLYISKTCHTLSIIIIIGILRISRVFWRIFTQLLYGSRPLTVV